MPTTQVASKPRDNKKVPQNARLWNMIVTQARAKFRKYPSPAASHWVHAEYVKRGGQFVASRKNTDEARKKESSRRKRSSSKEKKS